jgi:hypothetical protein
MTSERLLILRGSVTNGHPAGLAVRPDAARVIIAGTLIRPGPRSFPLLPPSAHWRSLRTRRRSLAERVCSWRPSPASGLAIRLPCHVLFGPWLSTNTPATAICPKPIGAGFGCLPAVELGALRCIHIAASVVSVRRLLQDAVPRPTLKRVTLTFLLALTPRRRSGCAVQLLFLPPATTLTLVASASLGSACTPQPPTNRRRSTSSK